MGFVKIPNRACVALSRAKQGFFLLGNFAFLAGASELWAGIRKSALDAGIIGGVFKFFCLPLPDRFFVDGPWVPGSNARATGR